MSDHDLAADTRARLQAANQRCKSFLTRVSGSLRGSVAIRGYLETITHNLVSGWAWDPRNPQNTVTVKAIADGKTIGEARADLLRPDTGRALGTKGFHGFRIPVQLTPDQIGRVVVMAYSESKQDWIELPRVKAPAAKRRTHAYQSIGGKKGSSDSASKLAALRLERLQRPGAALPLEGFSVLDIGCNEGFFCVEALKLGAAKVTGIDRSKDAIEAARHHCPEGTFIHGSWWDLPDARYDLILFLSALHYEKEEKRLLDELCRHLTPDGTLVLECGVILDTQGGSGWRQITRGDGPKRYATQEHLVRNLLSSYSARRVARSVDQKGDPVPRWVFHCRPRRPMALLIQGRSGSGKTTLAESLAANAIPTYKVDQLFTRLSDNALYANTPLGELMRSRENRDFAAACRQIIADGRAVDLAQAIAAEIPSECLLFCVEGEALTHDEVLSALKETLAKRGVMVWTVAREHQ
jgi:SAM-dependent methyltransferase